MAATPRIVWLSPDNRQSYITGLVNDPNVPAGYVLTSGSDGAPDAAMISYMGGINSSGYPRYVGDPLQRADFPNGINSDGVGVPAY